MSPDGSRRGPRIEPSGEEWRRIDGPGYTIHADRREDQTLAFAEAVARGLEDHPRWLHCKYLYDERGSEIYERITEQPEYYPTRTEEEILATHADELREAAGETVLIELGSGSSAKTRHLLDAWCDAGPCRYVPIDISLGALEPACRDLAGAYPELAVEGIAASYERALPLARALSPTTLAFLGSTVGNFNVDELDEFLELVGATLSPGDRFLLGVDLVKDPSRLEAAYNDAAGWTERFNRNLFRRINRELGADVTLDAVEHVAYYNDRLERVEIYARFLEEVEIELAPVDRRFRLASGEMVLIEISRKFRVGDLLANLSRFGFRKSRVLTDDEELFAVLLLERRRRPPAVVENRMHRLESLLGRVRSRTLEVIDPLSDDDLARPPSPIMGPIVWDLGHVAAFEKLWLVDALDAVGEAPGEAHGRSGPGGELGVDPDYDPFARPRGERAEMELPERAEVLARMSEVRSESLERLRAGSVEPSRPLTAEGYVYRMVAQHESQHQETMLQAIQLLDVAAYDPPFRSQPPPRPDRDPSGRTVLVPAGEFLMGTDDRTIAYDNERPRHPVELDAFRIDAAPVTNGMYLRFVEDGGYRRREPWSDEGWEWLREAGVEAPGTWIRQDGDWCRRAFGRIRRLDPGRPVMHVSWYEAAAYARWAGKRLPTEAEWEKAAAWDSAEGRGRTYPWGERRPDRRLANLGQELLEPAPVGSYPTGRSFYGCHQTLGDVWEWTASPFAPYPGFAAFPYRRYSEVFFGEGHRVLRGCSWAVPRFAARTTYRNWDLPQRRQIFAGFRCARDG